MPLNKKAGALGVEPRSTASKAGVLPLHHAPVFARLNFNTNIRLIREDSGMKSRVNVADNDLKVTIFPLLDWISAYLNDCLSRGLSPNTIRFYQEKLDNFIGFCRINNLHDVQDISTHDLRNYFIGLQENHTKGGVHAFYRTVKTFLFWYE